MAYSYIYTGKYPTRVKVSGIGKPIDVQPGELIHSDVQLRQHYFKRASAETVDEIKASIENAKDRKVSIADQKKGAIEVMKARHKEEIKEIEASFLPKEEAIDLEISTYESQLEIFGGAAKATVKKMKEEAKGMEEEANLIEKKFGSSKKDSK